jgi:hypothetical protein
MRIFAVTVNLLTLTAMAVVYANHVSAVETKRLQTQIMIERTVAQALLTVEE